MDQERWHIYRTFSGHEVALATEASCPAYVPHKHISYFDRRKRKQIVRRVRMLDGYVFLLVRHPRDIAFAPDKHRIGFLRNGDRSYATLSPKAFELLKRLEFEMTRSKVTAPAQALKSVVNAPVADAGQFLLENPACAGDQVGIEWLGTEVQAIVKEIRGETVLAELIGTSMRITVSAEKVRAA